MAYVVRRPRDRWEIRESTLTPAGPRARTLATFRVLTPEVLDKAEGAAERRFDRSGVMAAARRAGAPAVRTAADGLARQLLAEAGAGRRPSPGLRRLLVESLGVGDPGGEWIAMPAEARGRVLRDLLDLGDQFPRPKDTPLRFPPFAHGA